MNNLECRIKLVRARGNDKYKQLIMLIQDCASNTHSGREHATKPQPGMSCPGISYRDKYIVQLYTRSTAITPLKHTFHVNMT